MNFKYEGYAISGKEITENLLSSSPEETNNTNADKNLELAKIEEQGTIFKKLNDYFVGNNGEYVVRCRVREQDSNLIDLTFQVPSKKQAESACSHWAEKSQNIYATIMKELL